MNNILCGWTICSEKGSVFSVLAFVSALDLLHRENIICSDSNAKELFMRAIIIFSCQRVS